MMARARARMAGPIQKSTGRQFASKKQFLLDGELGHQAEFLEYRTDADNACAVGGRDE